MTTPPYTTTDLRVGSLAAAMGVSVADLTADPAADYDVQPLTVRLDRIRVSHDELWEAIGALTEVLAPVLGSDPHAAGDDQPEWQPDGGSPLAAKLALHASNAAHLAARVRAITAAVDL